MNVLRGIMEKQLLLKLLNYQFFSEHRGKLIKGFFEKELELLYKTIEQAHEEYKTDLTLDWVNQLFKKYYPAIPTSAKKNIANLLDDLQHEDVPPDDMAKDILQDLYEKELARQIVADGLEVINGTKKIAELHTSAISLLDNVTIESLERYEEVQFDLNGLLDFTDPKNLYPFRLPGLQEKILGAGPGNFVIVFARPECYTYETEILTESGWIQFQDLKDNIKVAQVLPNNLIEFVYPIKKVNYHYNGKLINFKDTIGRINISVTPDHKMVYYKGGKRFYSVAKDFIPSQGIKLYTAGEINFKTDPLSDLERFLIAYNADGTVYRKGCNGKHCGYRTVRFSLTKKRKQERLENILSKINFKYTKQNEKFHNTDELTYYIQWPISCFYQPNKTFSWINIGAVSLDWCRDFIEELSYWVATRRTNNRYKYDTTKENDAKIVQSISILAKYNVKYSIFKDKRGYKDIHSLSIRTNYQPIDGQSVIKSVIEYKEDVYCVTVPSGVVLIRSNNQTLIC